MVIHQPTSEYMLTTDSITAGTDGGDSRAGRDATRGLVLPNFTDDGSDRSLELAVDLANHEQATLTPVGMEQVPQQTLLDHPRPSLVSHRGPRTNLETIRDFSNPLSMQPRSHRSYTTFHR